MKIWCRRVSVRCAIHRIHISLWFMALTSPVLQLLGNNLWFQVVSTFYLLDSLQNKYDGGSDTECAIHGLGNRRNKAPLIEAESR